MDAGGGKQITGIKTQLKVESFAVLVLFWMAQNKPVIHLMSNKKRSAQRLHIQSKKKEREVLIILTGSIYHILYANISLYSRSMND